MIDEDYVAVVGDKHRQKFAQFFTNNVVASFMTHWVLRGKNSRSIYDPAFGLGAFYYATPKKVKFFASEIDNHIIRYFGQKDPYASVSIKVENYLMEHKSEHENIVANPPYLKFHNFEEKDSFIQKFFKEYGVKLSGYTNIASAFLVKSIVELKRNGRLAYIMPSEFLNAGYGCQVKDILLKDRHLYAIVSIECEKEVFANVTTSVCIVLYDRCQVYDRVSFYTIKHLLQLETFDEMNPVRSIAYDDISPEQKWEPYLMPLVNEVKLNMVNLVPLSHYGCFKRGIATGANKYFVLTCSKIKQLGLRKNEVTRCITKSDQIRDPIFTEDAFVTLSKSNEPVYIFSADANNLSDAALKYIEYGVSEHVNDAYLLKQRKPWYKIEHRKHPTIMINVFSRGSYKVILNRTKVLTLTPYHGFYPNIDSLDYVKMIYLYLYSSIGRKVLSLSKRRYGNQLDKFEPNDLNSAFVPSKEYFDRLDLEEADRLLHAIEMNELNMDEINRYFDGLIL